ncbi:SDR family NAD(P)-dependent oxidoreductase [Rhodococcus sp. C26F]
MDRPELGADIVICDRCEDSDAVTYPLSTKDDLEETAYLVEATGRRCIAVQADTADRSAVEALVRRADEELGRIDIAVANAGVSAAAPVQDLSRQSVVRGHRHESDGCVPHRGRRCPGMIERGYGRIASTYVRKVRTASGAVAVQVACKHHGRVEIVEHVGSAHTDAELGVLLA